MIYNPPVKGDDGHYFVKALTDTKRKCLVQVNKVNVSDVSGELVFDLVSPANINKINAIDTLNCETALINSKSWFGKELSENVIKGAYTSSVVDGQFTGERIENTKVFNQGQEQMDFDSVQVGKSCDVILEFAGVWFAKKSFSTSWNVVQIRTYPEPIIDTYPEEYAFVDEIDEIEEIVNDATPEEDEDIEK
jgi:hypothetical protein|tara:strand:- start:363 stop:938 length:576 start_codon:yes stop_codon:yes gene_type:complete